MKPCQSQAVLGNCGAENSAERGFEQRTYRKRRDDADHETCQNEKLGRKAHEERRLLRGARQPLRWGPEEHFAYEAQRVGDGEHAGDGDDVRQRLVHERVVVDLDGLGEEHLLGEKAVQQRDACHRSGGDHRQRRRDRHEPPQAAQATDVARAGFVVDDPGRHEQRRLERRMVHDVEDRGDLPERRVETDEQRDQPEMADRRVGEQPFQVLLENSDERAENEGDQPCRSHEPQPFIGSSQRRPEPHQKEHAGFHHGG